MAKWYLLRAGESHGPYEEEQIRDWIQTNQINPDEKLCREGDTNWLSLDMIPEFSGADAGPEGEPAPAPAPAGAPASANPQKDKTIAGILAILLGWLGVHHFYLGNIGMGILYIVLSCVGVGGILGIIDRIIYLTKPDDQFQRNYTNWFCSGD